MKLNLFLGVAVLFAANAPAQDRDDFTFEDLRDIITIHDVRRIGDLLAHVPEPVRSHFALVRNSHSLQGASFAHPRVIHVSDHGRLFFAYNGSPEQRGYKGLEVIQFRPDRRTYEFRHISFPESDAGEVHISDPNPPLCLTCHSGDPHPFWDPYSQWPAAYGRENDVLNADEQAHLIAFKTDRLQNERYRWLILQPGSANAPFEVERPDLYPRLRWRPNLRMTAFVTAYMAQRNLRILAEAPKYDRFRFLFAMSVLDNHACFGPIDPGRELVALFGSQVTAPLSDGTTLKPGNVWAFILRAIGLRPADWKSSVNEGSSENPGEEINPYSFNEGFRGFETLVFSQIYRDLAVDIPALRPSLAVTNTYEWRFSREPGDDVEMARRIDLAQAQQHMGNAGKMCPTLQAEYQRRWP